MADAERDYLYCQVDELQRSRNRWRLAFFVLLGLTVVPLLLTALTTALLVRTERARAAEQAALAREQVERARAEQLRFRAQPKPAEPRVPMEKARD